MLRNYGYPDMRGMYT